MKGQVIDWKKLVAKYILSEVLVIDIYKNSYNSKKEDKTQLKVGKIFEQTLHQRRSMNEEEAHEICSTLLMVRVMQINTIKRYLYSLTIMIEVKSLMISNLDQNMENMEECS